MHGIAARVLDCQRLAEWWSSMKQAPVANTENSFRSCCRLPMRDLSLQLLELAFESTTSAMQLQQQRKERFMGQYARTQQQLFCTT
jgi:hypothetical protein